MCEKYMVRVKIKWTLVLQLQRKFIITISQSNPAQALQPHRGDLPTFHHMTALTFLQPLLCPHHSSIPSSAQPLASVQSWSWGNLPTETFSQTSKSPFTIHSPFGSRMLCRPGNSLIKQCACYPMWVKGSCHYEFKKIQSVHSKMDLVVMVVFIKHLYSASEAQALII